MWLARFHIGSRISSPPDTRYLDLDGVPTCAGSEAPVSLREYAIIMPVSEMALCTNNRREVA